MTCHNSIAERNHQQEEGRKTEWEIEAERRFANFVADEDKVEAFIVESASDIAAAYCAADGASKKLTALIWQHVEEAMQEELRK